MIDRPAETQLVHTSSAFTIVSSPVHHTNIDEFVTIINSVRSLDKSKVLEIIAEISDGVENAKDRDEIIRFINTINDEGMTFGMMLATYHCASMSEVISIPGDPVLEYINILKKLLGFIAIPQEIFNNLALKNNNGRTFGMMVVLSQSEFTMASYINTLSEMHTRGICAKDILAVITIPDLQKKKNVIHEIFGGQDSYAALALLRLLDQLHGENVKPNEIIAILATTDEKNESLFDKILFFHDDDVISALYDLIIHLVQGGAKIETVYKLLQQSYENDLLNSLGVIVTPDARNVKKFLLLMLGLFSCNPDINKLTQVFLRTKKNSNNLAVKLFDSQNPLVIHAFCQFINILIRFSPSLNPIVELLKSKDQDGDSIFILIIESLQDNQAMICIDIFKSLYLSGLKMETLISLMRSSDRDGKTVGMYLAELERHKKSFNAFMQFVTFLLKSTSRKDLITPIFATDTAKDTFTGRQKWTLTDFVVQLDHHEMQTWIDLAASGLLSDYEYQKFVEKLPRISTHILSSNLNHREFYLRRALNQDDPFGKLFYLNRYAQDADLIKQLHIQELNRISELNLAKLKYQLFGSAPMCKHSCPEFSGENKLIKKL